jgi:hypothetical protein
VFEKNFFCIWLRLGLLSVKPCGTGKNVLAGKKSAGMVWNGMTGLGEGRGRFVRERERYGVGGIEHFCKRNPCIMRTKVLVG